MSMSIEKLQQLSGLLKEYSAEQESLRLPNLAAQVRDVADCVEQDVEVLIENQEYEEQYDRDDERDTRFRVSECARRISDESIAGS